jgi:predicted dehydrogenase
MAKKDRREFLKEASLAGAGLLMTPGISKGMASPSRQADPVHLAFIGVGQRGRNHVRNVLKFSDVNISAICDIDPEAIEITRGILDDHGCEDFAVYTEGEYAYEKMVGREDIDGVIISTPWRWHAPMAVATMKAGKYAGLEVSAAYTLEECWDLVNTSEETGMPCMILENGNFFRQAMAVFQMAKAGLFGELVHARGGYLHDLLRVKFNPGLTFGKEARGEARWRTRHALTTNADLYPTHGLGPLAAILDINRGNRFLYLTSTASKGVGLRDYILEQGGEDHPHARLDWKLGDVITSTIKTARGETIVITHDCNLPRPKGADFRLQGTDGIIELDYTMQRIYIENESKDHSWEDCGPYWEKYDHPLWRKHSSQTAGTSHAGDYFVVREFIHCIREQRQPVLDVYDAAAWSALTPLSEASIANGSTPQYFPDFTRGKWTGRPALQFT